ncbi:hypothetical protein EPTV-WA-032 [Eptesipox virus]|uniref:Uncharacterized protein n=1 Tax=Eptesipox virus TaxID=1329402 RepID=A0A220T694_9POXV|nr:hypothetical protein CG743_gp032 [Eptesipox virus]ASK51233.1 hypothetical protein EPTV-WA-032 [Eptesipox virus]
MEITKLDEILKLQPFKNMNKIKINLDDNCILGNRCFVKIDNVRYIPNNSISTNKNVFIRGHKFSLMELLYSPFHFQQSQVQYLLPSFVLNCIDEAKKKNITCKYCITEKNNNSNGLSINIFIPTILISVYIIIGLRIKDFWSSKFEIE